MRRWIVVVLLACATAASADRHHEPEPRCGGVQFNDAQKAFENVSVVNIGNVANDEDVRKKITTAAVSLTKLKGQLLSCSDRHLRCRSGCVDTYARLAGVLSDDRTRVEAKITELKAQLRKAPKGAKYDEQKATLKKVTAVLDALDAALEAPGQPE